MEIIEGVDGSRLTHGREEQYAYVEQSLQVWRKISANMQQLWSASEAELFSDSNPYQLRDTGQVPVFQPCALKAQQSCTV